MTVTLELNAEEVRALHGIAETEGVEIETVLHRLIGQIVPVAAHEAQIDPEESAEREREQAEMKANLERWHAERGTGT